MRTFPPACRPRSGANLDPNLYRAAAVLVKHHGEETLTALAEIAKRHRVTEIIDEPNFGDGMFQSLFLPYLRRIYPCTITEYNRK